MRRVNRGDMVRISTGQVAFRIGFTWEQGPREMDTDIWAYILYENGKMRTDRDIVFYNNSQSVNQAVCITDNTSRFDWEFIVDFPKLPDAAQRVVFVHTIYNAEGWEHNVSQIRNCSITLEAMTASSSSGSSNVVCVQEFGNPPQELLIICEFRKSRGCWFFVPLFNGFDGDSSSLYKHYGPETSAGC